MSTLKIYGVPNSQPVRAVVWACLMKGLPFDFVMTSQNKTAKSPAFLKDVNPRGTIPAIDDDGFVLWESHAILIYLAEKHHWDDLWPQDLQARALINQYLHFHHRNTREVVVQWSRALWPSVFDVQDPNAGWLKRNTFPGMENNQQVVADALAIIDGWLSGNEFLVGANLSLADISAYEELGQNQARYANCTDYSEFQHIQRWLEKMGQLPGHDQAHAIWGLIGDVKQISGGMKFIADANKQAAKIFAQADFTK